MRDQPFNNRNKCRQQRRTRIFLISSDLPDNLYQNNKNNIIWPVASTRKAHSSAFVVHRNPDYQLIVWLAEIMIYLHRNTVRRAHWSGPCGHHGGCRLIS